MQFKSVPGALANVLRDKIVLWYDREAWVALARCWFAAFKAYRKDRKKLLG